MTNFTSANSGINHLTNANQIDPINSANRPTTASSDQYNHVNSITPQIEERFLTVRSPQSADIIYLNSDNLTARDSTNQTVVSANDEGTVSEPLTTHSESLNDDAARIAQLTVTRVNPALGAEVRGLDLTKPMGTDLAKHIEGLIADHQVLVIKNQSNITAHQQVAFTEHFGSVEAHPLGARKAYDNKDIPPSVLVVKNPMNATHKSTIRNDYWHSDLSCLEEPVSLSVLRAIAIPATGWGDTMFANMYRAYNNLTPGMRDLCHKLNAVHNTDHYFDPKRSSETFIHKAENIHPVVRTHAITSKNSLFLSDSFIDRFEGMTHEESRPLLNQLIKHSTEPHNVYRHRWEAGDMVVWDNRCTMHYAVFDYEPGQPRHLERTTASGERPFQAQSDETSGFNK